MLLTSGSVFLLTCVLTDFLTPSIPPAFHYWLVFPWLQGLLKSHFSIVKFLCVFYTTACCVCSFHHSRIGILCLTCHKAFKFTVHFPHSEFSLPVFDTFESRVYWTFRCLPTLQHLPYDSFPFHLSCYLIPQVYNNSNVISILKRLHCP